MPLFHNRQPNPEMSNPPDKNARDNRKTTKAERTEARRTDHTDAAEARKWVKDQQRKDR